MIKGIVTNKPRSGSSQVAQVVKEVFHFQIPYWDQNSINLLVIGPIPFLGLDLIDPRSSFSMPAVWVNIADNQIPSMRLKVMVRMVDTNL